MEPSATTRWPSDDADRHPKYADWRTSGLAVDATADSVTYDITVE